MAGSGWALVVVVGEFSTEGQITKLLQQDDPVLTPLQEKLEGVARRMSKLGLWSAILIFAVLVIRFIVEKCVSKEWEANDANELVNFALVSVELLRKN